ncbi:regulator of chromosome condensation 1/beta-lactamase-inhibitor protein II [Phlyctochytrium arcticum]|nr:regulator of chromosome condensation 1/beta-lactamase-inhibitor protein II [Phlyctochytrium arcticum]
MLQARVGRRLCCHSKTINACRLSPKSFTTASFQRQSLQISTKKHVLLLCLGAGAGVALYSNVLHSDDIHITKTFVEITAVPLDQSEQVKQARRYPGVYIWGRQSGGKKGATREAEHEVHARAIKAFQGQVLRDLAFAGEHGAAIDLQGNLLQWSIPLGNVEAVAHRIEPEMTIQGKHLSQIACNADYVFALTSSGQTVPIHFPKDHPSSDKIVAIDAGKHHMVAVTGAGRVLTLAMDVRANEYGQIGGGSATLPTGTLPATTFQSIPSLTAHPAAQIACGDAHTLILAKDGRVFALGANNHGQLGLDTETTTHQSLHPTASATSTPREVDTIWSPPNKSAKPLDALCTKIAAGADTSFFVIDRVTGTEVLAAGTGLQGQLGHGAYSHMTHHPVRVKSISNLTEYDEHTRRLSPIRLHDIQVANNGGNFSVAVLDNGGRDIDPFTHSSVQDHSSGSFLGRSWRWLTGQSSVSDDASVGGENVYGRDVSMWGANLDGQLARADGKKGNSPVPVYPKSVPYATLNEGHGATGASATSSAEIKLIQPFEPPTDGSDINAETDDANSDVLTQVGRLQLSPTGWVTLPGGKRVLAQQKMVLGKDFAGVYFKAA